jgi:hypothetical protein
MHLPLPFCVLAFATVGAALSDRVYLDRLVFTYVGILSALCLGAYSLDELRGRPYHTHFTATTLWGMSVVGTIGAVGVALYLALLVDLYVLVFAVAAAFLILAYNLELFKGKFHNEICFGMSWGGLSCLGSFYVQAETLSLPPVIVAAMATVSSIGILRLTHRFRPNELGTALEVKTDPHGLRIISRNLRRIAWEIVKLECVAMVLLAIGLILPKLA